MAAGGLAGALALVPWGTLIDKAPQIAASAADLMAKARSAPPTATAVADPLAELSTRVAVLEARVEEASGLIASLASSNASLIASVERARRIVTASIGLSAAALIAAIAAVLT